MWPFKRRRVDPQPAPLVTIIPQQEEPNRNWWASFAARAWARGTPGNTVSARDAWREVYEPAPGVLPRGSPTAKQMAMDSGLGEFFDHGAEFGFYRGTRFIGYPYLSQLSQETEYRRPAEIIADHMTRKWITLTSTSKKDNKDKLKKLDAALKKLGMQDAFRQVALQGEFFGRSQIYLDTGYSEDADELKLPLFLDKRKVKKGGLKGIRVVEPYWTYPNQYNSTNPLKQDFYRPSAWYVMGIEVHQSRLLTFVPHEVPDILKPAYAFGGLSLTQMLMVDVDNWIRTRASVSDTTRNFAVSGVKTNLSTLLNSDGIDGLQSRAEEMSTIRDNRNLLLLDKDTEEYFVTATPLSSLDLLQAQAQEHMCLPAQSLIETERGQVPIRDVVATDKVLTRKGFAPIKWVGITDTRDTLVKIKVGSSVLVATEEHPVWVESIGEFVSANCVNDSHYLLALNSPGNTDLPSRGAADGGGKPSPATIGTKRRAAYSIASCGKYIGVQFRMALKSITGMRTAQTTAGIISSFSVDQSITHSMCVSAPMITPKDTARNAPSAEATTPPLSLIDHCIARMLAAVWPINSARASFPEDMHNLRSAYHAALASQPPARMPVSALENACSAKVTGVEKISVPMQPVYNIEVAEGWPPEFFADGVLVHNSSPAGIPLIIRFGITPSGLNATSDGELQVWADWIHAQQEHRFTPHLSTLIKLVQLSEFGEIDPDIGFKWESLQRKDMLELANVQKIQADTDAVNISSGKISPEEAREAEAADEDGRYSGIDLAGPPPPPPVDPENDPPSDHDDSEAVAEEGSGE